MTHQTTHQDTMKAAFSLVDPGEHAKQLAARGLIRKADAERVTWRDPIAALVTDHDLREAGVTIQQVDEAVLYMTATAARIEPALVAHPFWGRVPGYLVTADGYRRGPAGP